MKKKTILAAILLLLGLGFLLYPGVSSYVSAIRGAQTLRQLEEELALEDAASLALQRKLAEAYNSRLAAGETPGDYDAILNYTGHVMGRLEIPSIRVDLPIYHGTGDEALSRGVGHMEASAFPVGGEGNHAVLTGYTSLPSAGLFMNLKRLREGEFIYIHILGEVLTYRVEQIREVLPGETYSLQPEQGKDLCTLVTISPGGINARRLLVRGQRVENGEILPDVPAEEPKHPPGELLLILFPAVLALIPVLARQLWRKRMAKV